MVLLNIHSSSSSSSPLREMAYYNKGMHSSSGGSHRGRPYVLILLIIFGAALLGVMVLHKLRERRIYTLLVKEKDHQILALQLLLQKERDRSKELRGKNEEIKGKIYALRSQKMELSRTVVEMQSTLDSLKDEQKLMETAFEEQQNELRLMQEKVGKVGQGGSELVALRENLKHKEAEIEDLKRRLESPVNDHPATFPEIVTANGTKQAQDESEKEEDTSESVKHEGDDNEDASKSELTESKDGGVASEIKDEIWTEREIGKANKNSQSDGDGVVKYNDDAEVVYGREKKTRSEEHSGQVEDITDSGGQVKQLAEMKRKHGHARRTKGKRWRTTVNSSLMENNVASDNIGNRKVYKDEAKGRRIGKVYDEESFLRKGEGGNKNSPRKDKSQANFLKPDRGEANVTSSGTSIYPENQKLDEMRRSEVHEQSVAQQNWSKRHINKADKNAGQTKTKVLIERPEELEEILRVQKQHKDSIDTSHDDDEDGDEDIFKKSHSEFKDENNDYKEKLNESEYQSGL
ncbi:uncharacterized protein LOC106755956 [Vigna radiata var. radiata]|uniref:Uncharacterized protein LOC106755956 n=1 Tax=Vigna radiata var. radiata TaxID=3916 RepID=A0A1S3TIU7_VIGRR|nr:uncharacterized protein LOC106755956 [Vigna radiata var. radiata]